MCRGKHSFLWNGKYWLNYVAGFSMSALMGWGISQLQGLSKGFSFLITSLLSIKAMPRMTLIKKWICILLKHSNCMIFWSHLVCFSLSKYLETEYGTQCKIRNANFKNHLLWVVFSMQSRIWSYHTYIVALYRMAKKCTKNYNVHVQGLY